MLACILERQVRELRYRNSLTVIAVAGSVGKTSTKLAIGQLLGEKLRVQHHEGNYNDRLTVPLIFFGHKQPGIWNIFAWMRLIGANTAMLEHEYPYDVVVVELGTDGPGQMKQFAYLNPDITVLTAITPEHMVNFRTLEAVAREETAVFGYSRRMLVHGDLVPSEYLAGFTYQTYGMGKKADFRVETSKSHLGSQFLQIYTSPGIIRATVRYIGRQGAECALAAAAVATILGLSAKDVEEGLRRLEPFAGRMRVLEGVKKSSIIDDTYNATPIAVQAALDVLYTSRTSQRIAVLGSMNELGGFSREAHEIVGAYCDPTKLDLVLTLGVDAGRWIAPAAKEKGCVVKSFMSQKACAAYVRKHLKDGAVVLCKGSQNGVFAEEVVKRLLSDPRDAVKLVRQSPWWMKQKRID